MAYFQIDNSKIEDTVNQRVAKVAVDGDESVNVQLVVKTASGLPFISLSQISGTGGQTSVKQDVNTVEYNGSLGSMVSTDISNITNTLFDPEIPGRFTLVCKLNSMLSSEEFHIYYDEKYKDLFALPDTTDFGDSPDTKEYFKNALFPIDGYRIGVEGEFFTPVGDVVLPANRESSIVLPKPSPILTKTHIIQVGTRPTVGSNNTGLMLGNRYVESPKHVPGEFVSLGSSDALFGAKVPTFRYIRQGYNNAKLVYVGYQNIDDVLIGLPV
jgi:hypothetical protein